jgi:hypothetical protein
MGPFVVRTVAEPQQCDVAGHGSSMGLSRQGPQGRPAMYPSVRGTRHPGSGGQWVRPRSEDRQVTLPENVGPIDRVVRVVLGIGLVAVALGGSVAGPLLAAVWVVAAIALVTGAIGFCPLYFLLGISTAGNRLAIGRHSKA